MSFNQNLLEKTLVCTKCRSLLARDGDMLVCSSTGCRLKFAIIHEIPNMLVQDAVAATDAEWSAAMKKNGRDPVSGAKV